LIVDPFRRDTVMISNKYVIHLFIAVNGLLWYYCQLQLHIIVDYYYVWWWYKIKT